MRLYSFSSAILSLVILTMAGPIATAQPKALPSQQNNQGQVTVTVTPLELSKAAEAWRFEVQFNTHVVPLTQDLAAVSVLSGGGADEQALEWQGDPPGGHHRKGMLVFKPMNPMPGAVTLKVRQVGSVPERVFTWDLPIP